MKFQSGFPLLLRQYKALLWKNYLLSSRHKRVTLIQLLSSFFFVLLIFFAQKAIDARFSATTSHKTVKDPAALVAPPIPPCEEKLYIKIPCYDFVWSGNWSERIRGIVGAIMANNPSRQIPPNKVKSFETSAEVDVWLYANPMRSPGALHFGEINATVISYGIQTNSTPLLKRGLFEDPSKFQIPLQIAIEREIARSLLGVPKFSWVVALKEFAHPKVEMFSAITILGPLFFLAPAIFGFVFQISSIVTEKELKLRQAMNLMGLYDSAYWLSWLTWEGLLSFVSSSLFVLFGMLFQYDFFLNNSFVVVFLVFFLFQLNMLAFAFMLSTFISKSSSSYIAGFSIFIIGSMTEFPGQLNFPYSHGFPRVFRYLWSFFPPNLLIKAIWLLTNATSTPQDHGVRWSKIADCAPNDEECLITIKDIYLWLVTTFFLWLGLAIYYDNVLPNEYGVRKSPFYFLSPRYWSGRGENQEKDHRTCNCVDSLPFEDVIAPDDKDVLKEEKLIKRQIREGFNGRKTAVQVRGLVKTYPATTNVGCFKCKRSPPYHAIKGLWMNIARGQLFCLLGTTGAGKTSVINCLTGMSTVTAGDALVCGNSVKSSIGLSRIRKFIGVCPQFDTLWDDLTGEEHIHFFASIKGLPESSIQCIVQKSLEEVRLAEAAKMRAGNYSGGMRRRLSFAIALIGNPKLIILDEPTTGMDPITRRHVWDVIMRSKKGRAIILTTHSMEEADILSDRIGIMANGRLQCIGTPSRLKSKFGSGFILHVSFVGSSRGQSTRHDKARHEGLKKLFKSHLDVEPKEESDSHLSFSIPSNRESFFPNCFAELRKRESEFRIADIQIGFTSLEEVFLSIAKRAELEAASEGRLVTLNLPSGLSIEIPVGATFVGIPGTATEENRRGTMVEVYWEQDDFGALCISGHSNEIPIPQWVKPVAPSASTSRRNFFRRSRCVRGIVIDPNRMIAH